MNTIGGYFELEIPDGKMPYPDAVPVNFGRGGLELIVRARHYRHIWIPDYICPVVPRFLTRLGIDYSIYEIDLDLEPKTIPPLKHDEAFLYVNYFGIKDAYCRELERIKKNLILDLTQAFYYEPARADGFNSARKFFGVPDGGFVFGSGLSDEDLPLAVSYDQCEPLLRRADGDLAGGYQAFHALDDARENLNGAKMALLTRRLFSSIDVVGAQARRRRNFASLVAGLEQTNEINVPSACAGALVFPYLVKDGASLKRMLIENRVFCPTYWPSIKHMGAAACRFVEDLVCIPCDQRLVEDDIQDIVELVKEVRQ